MELTWRQWLIFAEFILFSGLAIYFFGRGYIVGLILNLMGIIVVVLSLIVTPALDSIFIYFGFISSCSSKDVLYAVHRPCGSIIGLGYGFCFAGGICTIWQFVSERFSGSDER